MSYKARASDIGSKHTFSGSGSKPGRARIFGIVLASMVVSCVSPVCADPAPDNPPGNDPLPMVFCFRVTDIERVALFDGTPDNDFVFQFETLNWTGTAAGGVNLAGTIGTTTVLGTAPSIVGIGIDRDGRGGPLGGSDIDAWGLGTTTGSGTFDATAIQSGRGRGDIGSATNDWSNAAFSTTTANWAIGAGTATPFQDLLFVASPGDGVLPSALVPSQTPPFSFGDLDTLGDSAVDGGPGTSAVEENGVTVIADSFGNVLDGFTMTIQDWDIGEILSLNWFLLNSSGAPIGVMGEGNAFGFGLVNFARIPVGGALPGPVFPGAGNTGFVQSGSVFYDTVFEVPNPAEFGVEFGAGITMPFINPSDNTFDAPVVPEPVTFAILALGGLGVLRRRRR